MTIHPRTRVLLAQAGLAPVELAALDVPARHQVPDLPVGFGLIGPTGTGKSWTLAQHVARILDRAVRRQPDPSAAKMLWVDGDMGRDARVRWVVWLDLAEEIRTRRYEKRWVWVQAEVMMDVPLLVLDDIGREKRDEGDGDPAQAVLQRVLEHRYRHRLPLLWTSNRTREELTAFYGGPLASRLIGTWPEFEVVGQDMRLFPMDLKVAEEER